MVMKRYTFIVNGEYYPEEATTLKTALHLLGKHLEIKGYKGKKLDRTTLSIILKSGHIVKKSKYELWKGEINDIHQLWEEDYRRILQSKRLQEEYWVTKRGVRMKCKCGLQLLNTIPLTHAIIIDGKTERSIFGRNGLCKKPKIYSKRY